MRVASRSLEPLKLPRSPPKTAFEETTVLQEESISKVDSMSDVLKRGAKLLESQSSSSLLSQLQKGASLSALPTSQKKTGSSSNSPQSAHSSYRYSLALTDGAIILDPKASSMRNLMSFVPNIVVDYIQRSGGEPQHAFSEVLYGSILFLDIKGYSKLADILSDDARNGAEVLSRILNSFFSKLVEIVLTSGGDIIKFAGDAVICFFQAQNEESLSKALLHSASCAINARDRLDHFPINEDQGIFLTLHASIGAGKLNAFYVGGYEGKWEFFMSGTPFESIEYTGKLNHEAGDIYLTRPNYELIRDKVVVQQSSSPQVLKLIKLVGKETIGQSSLITEQEKTISESALRSYVVNPVLLAIDSNRTQWISEIRTVSVLFCTLLSTSLSEDRLDFWQSCVDQMQQAIHEFGGIVRQWLLDDKGATLVAAFGLPGFAHEDDVTRAVRSSMSIKARLNKLDVQSSLGVTTGKVYIGLVGNQQRCEYAMVGDVVNLAARLMVAAGGDIFCDLATKNQAEIEFEDVPPLTLKGKRNKVPAFRPVSLKLKKKEGTGFLFGREHEISVIGSIIDSWENQPARPSIILLEGPPGIGKSSIVREMVSMVAPLEADVLMAEGDFFEKEKIYGCWSSIFEELFCCKGCTEDSNRCEIVRGYMESFHSTKLELLPLLNVVLPLNFSETELTASMSAQCRSSNTEDLLVEILYKYLESNRVLLIFEDAHYFDQSSWDLILSVCRMALNFGIIITTRNQTKDNPYKALHSIPFLKIMKLEGLSTNAMENLIKSFLNADNICQSITTYVVNKVQGNPFFAEQLLDYLKTSSFITQVGGKVDVSTSIANLESLPVPDSVEKMILSRMDGLNESQKHVLKVGSIYGRAFLRKSIQFLLKTDSISNELADLVHLGILLTQIETPTASRAHNISGKPSRRAFGSMRSAPMVPATPSKESFTLEALRMIETPTIPQTISTTSNLGNQRPSLSGSQQSIITPGEVVYRFKNIITRDVMYNSMTLSQRQELHQQVAELFETLVGKHTVITDSVLAHHWALGGKPEKAIFHLERMGSQALHCYSNHEAVSCYIKILDLAQQIGQLAYPAEKLAEWHICIGEAYMGLGKIDKSLNVLLKALSLLGSPFPSSLQLSFRNAGQSALQFLHRIKVPFPGICYSDSQTQKELLCKSYDFLTTIFYSTHRREQSLYASLRALNLAEDYSEDTLSLARCYANFGLVVAYLPTTRNLASHYASKALELVGQASILQRLSFASQIISVQMILGSYYAGIGSLKEASQSFAQISKEASNIGDHRQHEEALSQLALVAFYTGKFDECLRYSQECMKLSSKRGDQQLYQRAASTAASCCVVMKKVDMSARFIGIDAAKGQQFKAYSTLALVKWHLGMFEDACQAVAKAYSKFQDTPRTKWHVLKSYAQVLDVLIAGCCSWGTLDARYADFLEKATATCHELQQFSIHYPFSEARSLYYSGLLSLLKGNHASSVDYLKRSYILATSREQNYDAALSLLILADGTFHSSSSRQLEIQGLLSETEESNTNGLSSMVETEEGSMVMDATSDQYLAWRLIKRCIDLFTKCHAFHDAVRARKAMQKLQTGHISILDNSIGI